MKHTKNILKSLLIMVMALSLLAVSCSKDEGKPTSPTPTKTKLQVAKEKVSAAAEAANALTADTLTAGLKEAAATVTTKATEAAEAAKALDNKTLSDLITAVENSVKTVKADISKDSGFTQNALKTLKEKVKALKDAVDKL